MFKEFYKSKEIYNKKDVVYNKNPEFDIKILDGKGNIKKIIPGVGEFQRNKVLTKSSYSKSKSTSKGRMS